MRKIGLLALLFFLAAAPAFAQTAVSATVVDASGIPYSFARVSAQLVPTGNAPTINGAQISPVAFTQADVNGTISFNLWSNALILPANSQWQITVCETPGVAPPLGTGSQCFTITATISGASQSLTTAMNAAAPRLTNITLGGTVSSITGTSPIVATPNPITGAGDVSCPTCANRSLSNLTAPTAINQQLLASNGTLAAPTYSFTASPGSGMRFTGTQLDFDLAGVGIFGTNGTGITAGNFCLTSCNRSFIATTQPTSLDPGIAVSGGAVILGFPQVAGDPATAGWGVGQKGHTWANTSTNFLRSWDGTGAVSLVGINASVGLTGQTTSIGTTTLFTTPVADGLYRVSASVDCETAVATATILSTISYTDISTTAQTAVTGTAACTALGAASTGALSTVIQVKGATNISYATTAANSPQYAIRTTVERLR